MQTNRGNSCRRDGGNGWAGNANRAGEAVRNLLRDKLKERGQLDVDEKGNLTGKARTALSEMLIALRAKGEIGLK